MERYSVLMSVYYKENPVFFRMAIDSMLQQTVPPTEIVLVCDGPLTPELDGIIEDVCGAYPELFRIVRLAENQGLGIALDTGLRACNYSLVARMDTDDIALPDRIEKQLKVFENEPTLGAVGGQIAEFEGSPEHIISYRSVPLSHDKICRRLKLRNPMNHMTVMLRKEAVLEAGSYRHLLWYEDYYLWARMVASGQKLQNIPDNCCYVRVDGGLYKRRGGKKYYENAKLVGKEMLSLGIINSFEYAVNIGLRYVSAVLISENLRKFLYCKFLRKNKLKDTE